MKDLRVPRIPGASNLSNQDLRDRLLAEGAQGDLSHQPWEAFRRPQGEVSVRFSLAYDLGSIFVLYRIREPELRAMHRELMAPVYEDSCVELFISDPDNKRYVNLEFNAVGACLGGIGAGRGERTWLPLSYMEKLRIWSSYQEGLAHGIGFLGTWELLVRIPLTASGLLGSVRDLAGVCLRCNLYKCGDKLRFPHYLAWRDIDLPSPDFHQNRFFGPIEFLR